MTSTQKIEVYAPGTIANFGPGFDVLGAAVAGLGDSYLAEFSTKTEIQVKGRDAESVPIDPEQNILTLAYQFMLDQFELNQPMKFQIDRKLPICGGLGGSATAAVAGALIGKKTVKILQPDVIIDDDLILNAALHGEGVHSGKHLDNIAPCFYGGLTICAGENRNDGSAVVSPVKIKESLHVLVFNPANVKIKTEEARKALPKSLINSDWTHQMGLTSAVLVGLMQGNMELVKHGLNDIFAEPVRKKWIPNFDKMRKKVLEKGGLGLSISGSGPTVFALAESEEAIKEIESLFQIEFQSSKEDLLLATSIDLLGARYI